MAMTRGLQANPRKAGDRKARSSTKSVVLTAGERMMGNLYTIRIAMVAAGHQHLACVKTMQQAVLPSSGQKSCLDMHLCRPKS